jgi:hypothetical protein
MQDGKLPPARSDDCAMMAGLSLARSPSYPWRLLLLLLLLLAAAAAAVDASCLHGGVLR